MLRASWSPVIRRRPLRRFPDSGSVSNPFSSSSATNPPNYPQCAQSQDTTCDPVVPFRHFTNFLPALDSEILLLSSDSLTGTDKGWWVSAATNFSGANSFAPTIPLSTCAQHAKRNSQRITPLSTVDSPSNDPRPRKRINQGPQSPDPIDLTTGLSESNSLRRVGNPLPDDARSLLRPWDHQTNHYSQKWPVPSKLCANLPVARPRRSSSMPSLLPLASSWWGGETS